MYSPWEDKLIKEVRMRGEVLLLVIVFRHDFHLPQTVEYILVDVSTTSGDVAMC